MPSIEHRSPPSPWQRYASTRCVTAEGVSWRAFEVSYDYYGWPGRALIFEHEQAWRRIRIYPGDCHHLTDAALVALLTTT